MNQDFSIIQLVIGANWVVQIVVCILLFVSVQSWAAIFSKHFALKKVHNLNDEFKREHATHGGCQTRHASQRPT